MTKLTQCSVIAAAALGMIAALALLNQPTPVRLAQSAARPATPAPQTRRQDAEPEPTKVYHPPAVSASVQSQTDDFIKQHQGLSNKELLQSP